MKSFLVLAFLILVGFIYVNRQRMYVRDPLGKVYVNNVRQPGAQVFINYSYDILLVKNDDPGAYTILVQDWDKIPGTPVVLKCVRWMACLAQADRAPIIPMDWKGKGRYDPQVTMTSRQVSFVAADGSKVLVALR
ncbi:MAG TPA: hypothetical protein VF865_06785 [Acidobacteriaceae bacterium]